MSYPADRASKRSLTITLLVFALTAIATLVMLLIYSSEKAKLDEGGSRNQVPKNGQLAPSEKQQDHS